MSENDLNALARECKQIADDHGFKDASVPEDVALIHSEASELLEEFRNGFLAHEMHYEVSGNRITAAERKLEDPNNEDPQLFKPVGIPSEVADIIIRCLHFSAKHGIDVHGAVIEKMAYNRSRPYKHGNKAI